MNIGKLKFHCSHISTLLSNGIDNRPLTDKQWEDMRKLLDKDRLTEAQIYTLKYYVTKETSYNPKTLTNSCKQDLIKIYAWQKYKRCSISQSGDTVALEKGTIAEVESIKLLSQLDSIKYTKNKRIYTNEFLKGCPDIVIKTPKLKVIDIKTSIDTVSFLSKLEKKLSNEYIMQMQGYLELVGAEYGEVCHCLVNMPPELIEQEIKRTKAKYFLFGKSDEDLANRLEILYRSMIFDDIPIKRRVIRIPVYRDKDKMIDVYERVAIAREWLKKFHRSHIFPKFGNG
jgi:hypothetical protein